MIIIDLCEGVGVVDSKRLHEPSAAFFDLPWPWPTSKPEAKPEAGTVPGFDSDAHRQFMRSLG